MRTNNLVRSADNLGAEKQLGVEKQLGADKQIGADKHLGADKQLGAEKQLSQSMYLLAKRLSCCRNSDRKPAAWRSTAYLSVKSYYAIQIVQSSNDNQARISHYT